MPGTSIDSDTAGVAASGCRTVTVAAGQVCSTGSAQVSGVRASVGSHCAGSSVSSTRLPSHAQAPATVTAGTSSRSSNTVRPWSTRTTLPRATLMPSTTSHPGAGSRADRVRVKGSASASSHSTSRTHTSSSGSVVGCTRVSRTAWRWVGSASGGSPVTGPFTSSRKSTSPGSRHRIRQPCPSSSTSVAWVAPSVSRHSSPPHVCTAISEWAARNTSVGRSVTASNAR